MKGWLILMRKLLGGLRLRRSSCLLFFLHVVLYEGGLLVKDGCSCFYEFQVFQVILNWAGRGIVLSAEFIKCSRVYSSEKYSCMRKST